LIFFSIDFKDPILWRRWKAGKLPETLAETIDSHFLAGVKASEKIIDAPREKGISPRFGKDYNILK
jgi:hypothetical protein